MRLTCLVLLALATSASAQRLVPRDGSSPIAIRSHRVEAMVEDGLARTTVRHTFVNHHPRPLEAIYLFPLPSDAALIDVAMEVGGERHEGLLAERKRARRTYDDIVRRKQDPALVEQVGDGTFRLSVFPVVPDEETVVELSWIQRVPLQRGAFHYVYPLALAGGPKVETEHDFTATITLRSAVPLARVTASAEDAQVVRRGEGEAVVALERVGASLDRDLVVSGHVTSGEPNVAVRTRRVAGQDGWFQVVITPPEAASDQLLARDVILVLDTSGSMGSEGKIEQAKASALWLLDNLRPVDRVNVLRFSSDVQAFAQAPVPATPEHLAALRTFVEAFEATGSTALGDALQLAIEVPAAEGRVRTVVLLTDGRPTMGEKDPAKLVGLARAGGERGLRLFPFGVGQDVDSGLLRGIGAAGRGRAEVFRPGGEIETRLTRFLTRTSSPMLADLDLAFEGADVYDVFPRPLPDLYLGEQVTVSGRYRGGSPGRVTLSATVGGVRTRLTRAHDFAAGGGAGSVPYLFARQKLDHLEEAHRLRLGLGDDAYYAALDRGAYSTADEIVDEMVAVSLAHGVQCAHTSFLVLLPQDRARFEGFAMEEIEEEEEELLLDTEADADMFADSPFEDKAFNDVIGVGGGAGGGKYGGRFGGDRNLRAAGGRGTEQSLKDGLEWLKHDQSTQGHWEDVGSTGLALLAFLGDGNTLRRGPYRDVVTRGVKWLRHQQDPESGLFSPSLEEHVLASLVVSEAYHLSRSPLLKAYVAQAALALARAQDPAGGWRADPSSGMDDVALTCWAVQVLICARDAGIELDDAVFEAVARWLDSSGDANPPSALLARFLLGQDPRDVPAMTAHSAWLADRLTGPGFQGTTLDWVSATYAAFQTGGAVWKTWNSALKPALLDTQRKDGGRKGSWDPPAGSNRVDETAANVLCLEVYFRYSRLAGAR